MVYVYHFLVISNNNSDGLSPLLITEVINCTRVYEQTFRLGGRTKEDPYKLTEGQQKVPQSTTSNHCPLIRLLQAVELQPLRSGTFMNMPVHMQSRPSRPEFP